jgi:hypothetical protein
MKKLSLIIIGIVYSISCFGQKIALNDTVSIELPKQAIPLNRDGFEASVNENFSYSKLALNSVPKKNERLYNKHFYKVGDILIKLTHGKRRLTGKEDYLTDTKKQLNALFSLNGNSNNNSSVIKTFNNNPVLIIYYEMENVGYYDFYCYNFTNTFALNGRVQFKLPEKDKATKILNDLLNSIQFTK